MLDLYSCLTAVQLAHHSMKEINSDKGAVGTDQMLEGYGQNLVVVVTSLSCGRHGLDDVVGSVGMIGPRDEERRGLCVLLQEWRKAMGRKSSSVAFWCEGNRAHLGCVCFE